MAKKCFVDRDHEIMMNYYDFMDLDDRSPAVTTKKMKQFIKEDPEFLDPYLVLYELYQDQSSDQEADKILEKAFTIAIKTITDKKGEWPKEMLWGYLENRHIIRTLLNKAINLWVKGQNEEALDLLRKLLFSNPRDNIGARNYILAILLEIKFSEFETEMLGEYGYDAKKIIEFQKKMKDFPDEFNWWFEAVKKY